MAKQHKITEELCESCVYQTGHANETGPFGICGYLLATNESRVFRLGNYRDDYKPGYCQVYKKK